MMLVIDWRVFAISLTVFLITVMITRIVSLGSIISFISAPILTFIFTYFVDYANKGGNSIYSIHYVIAVTVLTAVISTTVTLRHLDNIKRLLSGTQKRMDFSRLKDGRKKNGKIV